MKAWKPLIVAVGVALLSGCSSELFAPGWQTSSKAVVAHFFAFVKSGAGAQAKALLRPRFLAELQINGGFQQFFDEAHASAQELEVQSIIRLSSSEDSATYRVTSTRAGHEESEYDTITLNREGRRWLITEVD